MTMTLEATQTRKAVYSACKAHDDRCTGCPFRYSCEEHFPEIDREVAVNDLIPADYILSDDGSMFIAEVR
jgi:hypothetical protein